MTTPWPVRPGAHCRGRPGKIQPASASQRSCDLPSPFRPQAVPRLQRPACLARLRRSSFTTRQATGRRTGGHPPFSGGSEDPPIEGVPPTRGSGRLQGRQIASPSLANPLSLAVGDPACACHRRPLQAGRHRRRHDRAGQAALEARSRGGRRAGPPTPARLGARLGNEWQDDDGGDGSADPEREAPARAQQLRREPRLRCRVDPAHGARRGARPLRGRRGRFARGRPPAAPACGLPRQPVPRPARPLRRAGARRRSLAGGSAGATGRFGARRQR